VAEGRFGRVVGVKQQDPVLRVEDHDTDLVALLNGQVAG
jgi:hypothetical protein